MGLEPTTAGATILCSTNWATPTIFARLAGIEPATYGLEGRCSILLSYRRTDKLYNELKWPNPQI